MTRAGSDGGGASDEQHERRQRQRGAYTFGDTDQAAERLALVAEVFAPTTRRFIADVGQWLGLRGSRPDGDGNGIGLALDLGCGPGHTTRLLARELTALRTVGLDRSAAFIEQARLAEPAGGTAAGTAGPAFMLHDISLTPFPVGPADVVFCRFLLTHLPSPGEVLAGWASQLAPSGVMLVDEVDRIDPGHPVFREYLAAVDSMLTHEGHRLYIGPQLDAMPAPAGTERFTSRVVDLSPPPAKAARMFAMNLAVWRTHTYARTELGEPLLDRLAAGLAELARDPGDATITWGMRQIGYRRAA
jgi:trans-aconitate 2-methyltransferase